MIPWPPSWTFVSFNEYRGWYSGGLNDIEGVHFHIAYQKPVVISEFGGEALGGFHGDSTARWTEEYQEALYVHQLRLLSTLDGLRGMTPWILVDFSISKEVKVRISEWLEP